jgi:hypothetical protein
VAGAAGDGLALDDLPVDDSHPAGGDEFLAASEAAGRDIGDEPGARAAQQLGLLFVLRHLDDPAGDRLGLLLSQRQEQVAEDAGLGHAV